jgi:hypothetical protein
MLGTENMFTACERVVRNGGAAGVDGMTVKELEPYLIAHHHADKEVSKKRGNGGRVGQSELQVLLVLAGMTGLVSSEAA